MGVQPYDGSTGVSERFFGYLARTQCALIMGFPVDSVNPDPPGALRLTQSYLETGYVIASLHRHRTLASIPTGAIVSVGSSTVPNFYLVGALGPARSFVSDVHLTQDEALEALVRHRAPVAMVWAPSVVRFEAEHAGAPHILMTALPIPHARWGVAALYAAANAAFAKRFNAALATLKTNGTLARYSAPVGLEAN